MTDRKMLELAARAIGRRVTGWNTAQGEEIAVLDDGSFWQPLHINRITDCMGDALRLAVKLRLRFWHDGSCANVYAPTSNRYCWTEKAVVEANDRNAATRLAITRAAAEIGRIMP